jgi:hypothetical protein
MARYPLDLGGVFAKLDRAAYYIGLLAREVAEFRKEHPITTFAEFEGGQTFLVKVRVPETPDLRWGVMLGDAIHNLRCALDHAVWELVQRNVRAGFKAEPTEGQKRRITYPIAYERKDFYKATAIRFLTTRQVAFVRRYQPYLRPWPQATPLGELAWLSNTDKHRIVHSAHAALETWDDFKLHSTSNLSAGRGVAVEPLIGAGDRLEEGTAIVRLTYEMPAEWRAATGKEPWVEIQGEFRSDIHFGDETPLPASELSRLHDFVLTRTRALQMRLD